MKRFPALILILMLLFSLCACGSDPQTVPPDASAETPDTQTPQPSDQESQPQPDTSSPATPPAKEESVIPTDPKEFADYINEETAETYGNGDGGFSWYFLNNTLVIKGTGAMENFQSPKASSKNNVAEITNYPPWAEVSQDVQRIIVDDGVLSISPSAFYKFEELTQVVLSDTVSVIGNSAFASCTKLETLDFLEHVRTIYPKAFAKCGVKHLTLDFQGSLESVADSAFEECQSLETLSIITNKYMRNTGFGKHVFSECTSLREVSITAHKWELPAYMFQNCSALKEVSLSGVSVIGDSAFAECTGLESVTLPEGLTSLGIGAFDSCTNLVNVTFPESLDTIESRAFANCTSLKDVQFPKFLRHISTAAFADCTSLTEITIPASVDSVWGFWPHLKTITFEGDAPEMFIVQISEDDEWEMLCRKHGINGKLNGRCLQGLPGYEIDPDSKAIENADITIYYSGYLFDDYASISQYNWVKQ